MIDIEREIEGFKTAAAAHAAATNAGNYRNANKEYKLIINSLQNLKASDSFQQLIPLLEDENIEVRVWASTYLLAVVPNAAEMVLSSCCKEEGNMAFSAEITLQEWKKGSLRLPL